MAANGDYNPLGTVPAFEAQRLGNTLGRALSEILT